MAQKGLWNLAKERIMKERKSGPVRKVMLLENGKPCMKKTSGAAG